MNVTHYLSYMPLLYLAFIDLLRLQGYSLVDQVLEPAPAINVKFMFILKANIATNLNDRVS